MKLFILVLSITLYTNIHLNGQEREYPIKKNIIKCSVASSGIINGMISLDYERNIINYKYLKFNIEVTYGSYSEAYTHDYTQSIPRFNSFTSTTNSLLGKGSHFFELSLGVRYSIINDTYYEHINPVLPVINIGYRYQNPFGKGLVFKSFIGTTGLGLSVGKSF